MKGLYEIQRENELKAIKNVVSSSIDAGTKLEAYQVLPPNYCIVSRKVIERLREVFKLDD